MVQKYAPSLLDLVTDQFPVTNLPLVSDLTSDLLKGLTYEKLFVNVSADKATRFFALNILAKEIRTAIPGTGCSLVFFDKETGQPATGKSTIPLTLKTHWELRKYVEGFKADGFAYTPEAFFDLLLALIDVSEEDFIGGILFTFIDSADPYEKLVDEFIDTIDRYKKNQITINDEVGNVWKNCDEIIKQLGYVKANIANTQILTDKVTQITQAWDAISSSLDLDFDIYKLAFEAFQKDVKNRDEKFDRLLEMFRFWLGDINQQDLEDLLVPHFELTVPKVPVALEFPRSVFVPIDKTSPSNAPVALPAPAKTKLTFTLDSLYYSTKTGFEMADNGSFDFDKSFLLGTKFTLEITKLGLDLSRTKNIPEATTDGRPPDFVGVYIQDASIGFPADWNHDPGSTAELFVSNMLAGTGGLSGTVGLRGKKNYTGAAAPAIQVKFGKFEASLNVFSLTFQHNAITKTNIQGTLKIPGLKEGPVDVVLKIKINFNANGDFDISTEAVPPKTLKLWNYLNIVVKDIAIGKRAGKFYLAISGSVGFTPQGSSSFIGNALPEKIDVQKLLIWDDGQIELEGGVVTLAKPIKLNLGPVKLTVTALGMGSHERMHKGELRKYKYVEFSAGISVNPGGVDARGDGIKVYFTCDPKAFDLYIRIQSISIDLIIPGSASKDQATLLLNGYLSMKEPTSADSDAGTEYAGGIDFKLPKMKMGGSAEMRYNPKVPSFLIDVSLEISTPIVLGATGMGIYGFRALFGKRYIASKTEPPVSLPADAEWWQYYKKKVPPKPREGITASKMANLPGFSFGAGVSLATAADGGQAFSSKVFFLLSLPDVFLLQGQAQILKGRIGLDTDTDPPFYCLLAIDKTSISSALGVSYKIPDSGDKPGAIITVEALIEMAYFWRDSKAWYLNIGRDQPVDRRVRARIFDLFDVYSYFMLNASGIRAGAGASIGKEYKVGPIQATMHAYMDTAGRLSFKPLQIGGSIDIGGNVDIKVCGLGFSVVASASLAAEAPKPFIVTGRADACVKVLKKEYCCHFDFTWTFKKQLDFSEVPLVGAVKAELQSAVKALNMMSQESLEVLCIPLSAASAPIPALTNGAWSDLTLLNKHILPMDSYLDIEFKKPVNPNGPDLSLRRLGGTNSGAEYTDYVAPQRGKSDRVRHDYVLNKVEIFSWDPGSPGNAPGWKPYNVFEALIAGLKKSPFNLTVQEEADLLTKGQYGFWQIDNPGKYTKLRLLAQNPLSFLRQGTGDTIPEELGTGNGIFCKPPERLKICVNFDSLLLLDPQGRPYFKDPKVVGNKIVQHQRILTRIVRNNGELLSKPLSGVKTALSFAGADTLELYLPEPSAEVSLLVGTTTEGLTIKYFARKQKTTVDPQIGVVRVFNKAGLPPISDKAGLPIFDNAGLPVFEYVLISTVVKTAAQLTGGISYSDLKNPVDKIEITGKIPIPVQKKDWYCETTISSEARALLQLLNLIGKEGLIIPPPKPPRDMMLAPYRETALAVFPNFQAAANLYYFPTAAGSNLTINFSYTLDGGPLVVFCQVTLAAPPGMIGDAEWKQLGTWAFMNLRPDTTAVVSGTNYNFLVDAKHPNGTILPLKGISKCIPIFNCYNQYLNFFHQICYLTTLDAQYNQNLPSPATVTQNNESMALAINKTLWPVWRPDTVFAVRVQYTDKVFQESTFNRDYEKAFVIGFKTQGPVGHYHEFPTGATTSDKLQSYKELEKVDKEDVFKLSSLKHYIDYPKSYPNADGNILNAKPLYYGSPELRLFYIYPHVYQFYQDWEAYHGLPKVESALKVLIKDPAELPSVSATPAVNEWKKNDFPIITPDIAALNNMIGNGVANQNPCVPSLTPFTPPGINNLVTPAPSAPLEPLKLYTAVYKAAYKPAFLTDAVNREVHRYGFQTSRYKDFKEHINSYILQSHPVTKAIEKAAVYTLELFFPTPDGDADPMPVILAQQVLDKTLPADHYLHTEAALDFDKLIDRLFALSGLEPAENVQFNSIMDATGKMLGILVRSPEPFNDPKTPVDELLGTPTIPGTLEMLPAQNAKQGIKYFNTYFSKDNSSAFITNANHSMNVPRSKYLFTFRYKLFNGNKYEIRATEQVEIDFDPHFNAQ